LNKEVPWPLLLNDDENVQRAKRGDTDAYSTLLKKYSNLVYASALSIVRDFHSAEDLAQEAFVKAWFHLHKLEDGNKFGPWVCSIARRLCLDWLRRSKDADTDSVEIYHNVMDRQSNVEKTVERNLTKASVWEAINQLDEPKRLVTILYFISGYSSNEISELLNLSVSAVESRIKRAKSKLKKELYAMMKEAFEEKKIGQHFHDDVMWRIVPRIATIEIPVSNLKRSIEWYCKILGAKVVHETETDAMLHLQGSNKVGVPTLFLCQTDDLSNKLGFLNTNTNIRHSIIDFYVPDLVRFHKFLSDQGVNVGKLNYNIGDGLGGFGFSDPDGNLLAACNITHQGQVQ
jgi:RNA polymerase sigma-70 factor (ECF subfamily)